MQGQLKLKAPQPPGSGSVSTVARGPACFDP